MIPYVRTVNYLSASSLMQLESNPVDFYLRRLGPSDFMPPREEQGFPAAAGISFDAFVKRRIAELRGIKAPSLEFMLQDVRCERERAIELGKTLLAGYEACGALEALLGEGVGMLAIHLEDFAPGTTVPLQAKLDAITLAGGEACVHDWKVKSAGRPGEMSPTPGYKRLLASGGVGGRRLTHANGHPRAAEPLEVLNPEWATQLALYGWLAGKPLEPVLASIDEVVVETGGDVRVAQFRAVISKDFQVALRARLVDAWQRIKEERVVPPEIAEHGFEILQAMR
jgi:hypothetical protein